jgi:hypothetical protein
VDRRANIVNEPGKCQLFGPSSATYLVGAFYQQHFPTGTGHLHGSGQTVGAGADDCRVEFAHSARFCPIGRGDTVNPAW